MARVRWGALPPSFKVFAGVSVAALLAASALFGVRAWGYQQERLFFKKQHAEIATKRGIFGKEEFSHFFDIYYRLEHGGRFSESDLKWCLDALDLPGPNTRDAAARRQDIGSVLAAAVPQLNPAQRERLFRKMSLVAVIAAPGDEIGMNESVAAAVFARLKDPRAVPILERMRKDPRWTVQGAAQEALDAIRKAPAA